MSALLLDSFRRCIDLGDLVHELAYTPLNRAKRFKNCRCAIFGSFCNLCTFDPLDREPLRLLFQIKHRGGYAFRGLSGFFRERFDLFCDYGEASPCITGAGCFNCRVQRKQVRLACDHFDALSERPDTT